jgi:hypothetical protein
MVSSEYIQMLVMLVTFLAAMTAILSYLGVDPGKSGELNDTDSIILNADGTVAEIWRQAEIYKTFTDNGNYYIVGYDKKLRSITPEEYDILTNRTSINQTQTITERLTLTRVG